MTHSEANDHCIQSHGYAQDCPVRALLREREVEMRGSKFLELLEGLMVG